MIRIIPALCALLLPLAALAATDGGTVDAEVLYYRETEAGTDPYPVRILVTGAWLRIDDGADDGDYILMDRTARRIDSVSHGERSILRIHYRETDAALPDDLRLEETSSTDTEAPAIQGRQPVSRQLLANGEPCLDIVTVAGLMQRAVTAMAEYARLLANREQGVVDAMPPGLRTPCYLSRFVYAPARHLQHGLPVQETVRRGYARVLVDFSESEQVPAGLFALPEGYRRFSIGTD